MSTSTCRVALLECDHVDPGLRSIAGDYGEMFARRFAAYAPGIEFLRVDVVGGQPLPGVGDADAVVVTGSRHSVRDPLPWIDTLTGHVRTLVDAEVPVAGICFGHQLLARALGGRVERAAAGWGVGVHAARVSAPRPWMAPPQEHFHLLVSHQDQVVEPPAGATVVAESDHAPIAAFEAGSALGFQGHPEFTPGYLDALMGTRTDRIDREQIEAARASLATPTDHGVVTRWLATFLAGRDLPSAGRKPASGTALQGSDPAGDLLPRHTGRTTSGQPAIWPAQR